MVKIEYTTHFFTLYTLTTEGDTFPTVTQSGLSTDGLSGSKGTFIGLTIMYI